MSRQPKVEDTLVGKWAAWSAWPFVALVLALPLLAGHVQALHPPPEGSAEGAYLSGASSEVLNFTITNPDDTGAAAVTVMEFYVPASGGTLAATGHGGGTWTAEVNPNAKALTFSAPAGENLAIGASKTFRVRYAPPVYAADTNEDWTVVSRDSLGENNTVSNPPNTVDWRTLGIEILGIKDPAGAQDGIVSSNQTINYTAIVRNTATTPVNNVRVRVATSTESVETVTFNAAAGSSTPHDVGPLKLASTLGARTVTASVQGVTAPVTRAMTLDVKRAPDLGSTFSSITNSTRFLSNDASAPAANRTSTVTVNARNVGEVDITNVATSLKVYNQAGQDRSTFFTITPATQTIASIAGGATGSTTFTVAPTGPSGNAPFDRYHINATFRFTDPNNNTSPTSQFHNTTIANRNPNGFLIADSAVPQATIVNPPSPSQRPFDRTVPNNEFTFQVTASDDTLNTSRVVLQLYPTDGRAPPLTAPLQAECKPDTVSGSIVCRDFMVQGNTGEFSVTKDFSRYELRGSFLVSANITDEAGNFLNRSIGTYTLTDVAPPAITNLEDSEADDEADLTTFITFQASVNDAYRVGRTPTGGNPAGTLNAGVFLRLTQDDTGEQIFPGDGLAMSLSGSAPFSNSGIYTVTTTVPRTGRVSWSIFACDAEVPANCLDSATNNLVGHLTIRSGVSMFFRSNGGNLQGVNSHSVSVVHQQNPATFGGITGNPGAGNATFPLTVRNDAGGTETYVFGCQLLAGQNLSGVTACEVVNALAPGVKPLNKNNTVTVAVSQVSGGVLSPLTLVNGIQVPFNAPQDVNVSVTVPPTARPGETGRVLFTVRSKFVPAANANVTLGFNVTEFRAVTFRHALTTVEVGAFEIKPSQTLLLPMLLENPGNLPQRYELPVPTLPTGWTFDWESTDSRWNDGGNNISLGAAGSPFSANRTVVIARITAAAGAAPASTALFNLIAQAASGPSDTFPVTLTVREPSLTIDPARPLGVHVASTRTNPLLAVPANTTVGPTEPCLDPTPRANCTFLPNQFVNFTLSVNLSSTKNPSNPSAFGKINAYVHLRGPDGTVENRSLQLVEVNPLIGGALLPGKNGTYQTVVQVRNKPGVYHFGLYADDGFNNDQFFGNLDFADDNQRFTVSEPAPLSIPFLWNRVVRADGAQLTPDVNNRFQAAYGSYINVTVNLGDAVHIGRANLRVDRILDTGQVVPATTLPIVMTRTAVLTPDGDRIKNATFEGSFRPTGSFLDNGGDYQFTLEAFDAVGNPVPLNTTRVFIVHLVGGVNRPPLAVLSAPDSLPCSSGGAWAFFDAGASWDPDGQTITYGWDFTPHRALTNPRGSSQHLFLPLGLTRVTLTVSDGDLTSTLEQVVHVFDQEAPRTLLDVSGLRGLGGWWRSSVLYSFQAYDNCGPALVKARLDTGPLALRDSVWIAGTGSHHLTFRSEDAAGNVEEERTHAVRIDDAPPQTFLNLTGLLGNNGWWRSRVMVLPYIVENGSGLERVDFNVSGTRREGLAILGDGFHDVSLEAQDVAGNPAAPLRRTFAVDTVAPASEATLHGTPGSAGWWRSAVTVTFGAMDGLSGVRATYAAVDDGEFLPVTSLHLADDGVHEVRFFAVDVAGNSEGVRTLTVAIDTVRPTGSITGPRNGTLSVDGTAYVSDGPVTVVVGVVQVHGLAEDTLSGVAHAQLLIDGHLRVEAFDVPEGTFNLTWNAGEEAAGPHEVTVRLFDRAGNRHDLSMNVTTVATTPEGLVATADCEGLLEDRWCAVLPRSSDVAALCRKALAEDVCALVGGRRQNQG